jgi:radical SAM protein with 4Fe4S-binding SPASM domain
MEAGLVAMCERLWDSPETDSLYICGAGLHNFHVDAYGHLSPCILARHLRYDLLKGSFKQGWQGFLHRVRTQQVSQDFKCRICPWRVACGSCPAFAQLENGDPETVVEFACRVGHLRSERHGLIQRLAQRWATGPR